MYQCLKFILFGVTHYMFRTVFPSIIRSSRLYIQQEAYVRQFETLMHLVGFTLEEVGRFKNKLT